MPISDPLILQLAARVKDQTNLHILAGEKARATQAWVDAVKVGGILESAPPEETIGKTMATIGDLKGAIEQMNALAKSVFGPPEAPQLDSYNKLAGYVARLEVDIPAPKQPPS